MVDAPKQHKSELMVALTRQRMMDAELLAEAIEKGAEHMRNALGLLLHRCDDQADAVRRVRVEQEARERKPVLFYLHLDSQLAWEGAYVISTIHIESVLTRSATWEERWWTYADASLPLMRRWLAEPVRDATEVTPGLFAATIRRGMQRFEAQGATDGEAVAALYRQIDTATSREALQ